MGRSVMNKDNFNGSNGSRSEQWKQKELFSLVTCAFVFSQSSAVPFNFLMTITTNFLVYAQDGSYLTTSMMSQMLNGGIFEETYPFLLVFGIFTLLANLMRAFFKLKVGGMSVVWLLFSLTCLSYLHGACHPLLSLLLSCGQQP